MSVGTDRRSVLTGLGALGVAGCGPSPTSEVDVTVFDLDLDLSALEARHGGRLGLCASGRKGRVNWRADERFTYCSTFKLFLAAATLERVQRGEERLDRPVVVTADDIVFHAPVTGSNVGGTVTVEALCQATVDVSDNPAANILIRELGGLDAWRGWYRSLGDQVTRVDRLEPALNAVGDNRDTTTPEQTTVNLGRLFGAGASRLTPTSRTLLLRWLIDTPTGPNRMKAGVPGAWSVAHKTGTSSQGPVNDIGMLFSPAGEPFAVAAYWQGPETDDFTAGDAAIAEATRIALSALGAHD